MLFKKMIAPILLILLVSLSLPAMASTGRIITMSGDVKVNGRSTDRGYRVKSGDLITTGFTGRVNIVMSDKSVLDLRPNTKFKLERFSFNKAKPREGRSVMSLLRGSFRYISGLVGRTNHSNARVRMGTATAGIRGSFATFGFDGKKVSVDVSLGQMTMQFSDGTTMMVEQGQSGSSQIDGEGQKVVESSEQDSVMMAAREILENPDPEAVRKVMEGLSEAEKAMVVAVIVANPAQLGVDPRNPVKILEAIIGIVKSDPVVAPLVMAIVTAIAITEPDELLATSSMGSEIETVIDLQALKEEVLEIPGVDRLAVEQAISSTLEELEDVTEEPTEEIVVDDTTITVIPPDTTGDAGGDSAASPSTP